MIQDTYQVEYKTTFQKIMVSHTVAKVSDYFTSEDFFSVVTENIKCELLSPSVGTTAKSVLINVKASVRWGICDPGQLEVFDQNLVEFPFRPR